MSETSINIYNHLYNIYNLRPGQVKVQTSENKVKNWFSPCCFQNCAFNRIRAKYFCWLHLFYLHPQLCFFFIGKYKYDIFCSPSLDNFQPSKLSWLELAAVTAVSNATFIFKTSQQVMFLVEITLVHSFFFHVCPQCRNPVCVIKFVFRRLSTSFTQRGNLSALTPTVGVS